MTRVGRSEDAGAEARVRYSRGIRETTHARNNIDAFNISVMVSDDE